MIAVCLSGCAEQSGYRLRLNEPWPDEYSPPGRHGLDHDVRLPPLTVRWHGDLNPADVENRVRALTADKRYVYFLMRYGLAERTSGPGPSRVYVVEVRLGRRYFPAEWATSAFSARSGTPAEVLSNVCQHLTVSCDLSALPADADRRTVRLEDARPGPLAGLAPLLAENDLFVSEWMFLPVTLRSWEYETRDDLLKTVAEVAASLDSLATAGRWTVVPFGEWHARAVASQREWFDGLARKLSGRRQIGKFLTTTALPTPTFLNKDQTVAKRQVSFAAAAQSLPADRHNP
jgi:hypothetical protein